MGGMGRPAASSIGPARSNPFAAPASLDDEGFEVDSDELSDESIAESDSDLDDDEFDDDEPIGDHDDDDSDDDDDDEDEEEGYF